MRNRAWSDMKKWEMMRRKKKKISKFESGQTRLPLLVSSLALSMKVAVSVIILSSLPVPLGTVTRRGGSADVGPALLETMGHSVVQCPLTLPTHTG